IVGRATLSIATPATTRASARQTTARMTPCLPVPTSVDSAGEAAGDGGGGGGGVRVAAMGPPLASGMLDFRKGRLHYEEAQCGSQPFRKYILPTILNVRMGPMSASEYPDPD